MAFISVRSDKSSYHEFHVGSPIKDEKYNHRTSSVFLGREWREMKLRIVRKMNCGIKRCAMWIFLLLEHLYPRVHVACVSQIKMNDSYENRNWQAKNVVLCRRHIILDDLMPSFGCISCTTLEASAIFDGRLFSFRFAFLCFCFISILFNWEFVTGDLVTIQKCLSYQKECTPWCAKTLTRYTRHTNRKSKQNKTTKQTDNKRGDNTQTKAKPK